MDIKALYDMENLRKEIIELYSEMIVLKINNSDIDEKVSYLDLQVRHIIHENLK